MKKNTQDGKDFQNYFIQNSIAWYECEADRPTNTWT